MRLRVPIRHDERIGNIAADETLPPVIFPGTVPFEMHGDIHPTAPFTVHRNLHRGFGIQRCADRFSRNRITWLDHEEEIELRGGRIWPAHTVGSVLRGGPWLPPVDRKGGDCHNHQSTPHDEPGQSVQI